MKKLLSLLLLSSIAMQAMDNAASQCAIEEKEFGGSIKRARTYCLYQSDMSEHDLASVLREISSTFSTPFLILHIAESNGKFLVLHSDADLAKLIKGLLSHVNCSIYRLNRQLVV